MKEEQSKQDVRALFHFFSRNIREQLLALPLEADGMEEVRLRVSAPLYYIYKNKEDFNKYNEILGNEEEPTTKIYTSDNKTTNEKDNLINRLNSFLGNK